MDNCPAAKLLVQKPSRLLKTRSWKERQCAIREDPSSLCLRKQASGGIHTETILPLKGAVVRRPSNCSGPSGKDVLEIASEKHATTWRLAFPDAATLETWETALRRAADDAGESKKRRRGGASGEKTVPQTPGMAVDDIPTRFLTGCNHDVKEALRRWRLTHEWRAANRMDDLLEEPQPHMDLYKRSYLVR